MDNSSPPFGSPFDTNNRPSVDWIKWFNWAYRIIRSVKNAGTIDGITPITGFSYAASSDAEVLNIQPAGTLASGSVVLPANPFNGQKVYISSSAQITSFTVSASPGNSIVNAFSGVLPAGSGMLYVYNQSLNIWYKTL